MRNMVNLKTHFKLLLLIIGTSVLFFLLYLSLYIYTIRQEKEVFKTTLKQYNHEIASLVELNSKTHTAMLIDLTFWDHLVEYTKSKKEKWFQHYIVKEFVTYEVDYIGVYDLNNQFINKTSSTKIKTIDFIPKEMLPELYKSKLIRFYMKVPEGVIEVFGATIHPSNDPEKNKSKPSGYLFMARLLDNQYFINLGRISNSKVSLASNNSNNPTGDLITTHLNLKDWKNNTLTKLVFQRPFNLDFNNTKKILIILVIASLINIILYLYYSRRWVYSPLKLVTTILETANEAEISNLKKAPGEFGYIGNLFEENSHQRKQLEIAKKRAEESDKLKSSFLSNLSHEIRTPMNAIIGFSELLNADDLTEENKQEYLRIIKYSGINLVSIIEDLIEMSKIDAKQIVPKFKSIDLDKCIKELYETVKVTIPKEKKIDFQILQPTTPAKKNIITDEIKLKQIIVNLITNAIKFTEEGYVTFGYEIDENNGIIEFTVKDSGFGIDEKNLKVIFDRFRRIDDFTIESSGLGLGLAISKAYVEMLGGSIDVTSILGTGSVFSFTIPLKFDEAKKTAVTSHTTKFFKNSEHQTILIAEDDNVNFLLLKKTLELKQYTVLRAVNGQEAVDISKKNPDIDLIFMDIRMPIMNGFEAFKIIKTFRPHLPIIAQTAYSLAEEREKIMLFGFAGYITKPLDKEKIFELLEELFWNE